MKKTFLITLLSVMFSYIAMTNAFADVPVDSDHFPSAEFRKMANGWDRDKDGIVEESEVSDVTNLFINQYNDISSLKGIECLTNLKLLMISGVTISQLDLSANTYLEYLECYGIGLRELKLGSKPKMTYLMCHDNMLTELDVSGCTKMYYLACHMNHITSLDLTKCPHYNGFDQTTAKKTYEDDGWILFEGGNYFSSLQIDKDVKVTTSPGEAAKIDPNKGNSSTTSTTTNTSTTNTSTTNTSTASSTNPTTASVTPSTTSVKRGKKTTVKITSDTGAKLTVKAKSKNAKNKKNVTIKSGKLAKLIFGKKAAKGTYKFTVICPKKGKFKKTTKIVTIKVK